MSLQKLHKLEFKVSEADCGKIRMTYVEIW